MQTLQHRMSSSISANLTVSGFPNTLEAKQGLHFICQSFKRKLSKFITGQHSKLIINQCTYCNRIAEVWRSCKGSLREKKTCQTLGNHLSFPTLTKQDGLHVVKVRNCL